MTLPADSACADAKKILRRQMIERREALTGSGAQISALAFCRLLPVLLNTLGFGLPDASCPLRVATYAAMRQEADLSLLCQELAEKGAKLYYPAISGRGSSARLVFGLQPELSRPENFLVPGHFGVPEPPPESWLSELPELDILFLPGLAFDRTGNRLGWGRAFYDRVIPDLPGRPVRVGVCHSFQVLDRPVPCGSHDQPVNFILTPDGLIVTTCDKMNTSQRT